jgi:hypothetical protein
VPVLTLNVDVVRKQHEPRLSVPPFSIEVARKTWQLMPNVITTGKRPPRGHGRSSALQRFAPWRHDLPGGRLRGRSALEGEVEPPPWAFR